MKKRGLINGIGKVYKFLFGTLTEDDKKEILNQMKILQKNQYNMESQVNAQISILKPLLQSFNETIATLSSNQNIISDQIRNLTEDFRQVNIRAISQQIINNGQSILSLIDALKTVYNPTVTLNEVRFMKKKLNLLYDSYKIHNFEDDLSYFKIMHQDVFFEYPNFYFIILVTMPLFSDENSFLYKLY